MPGALALALVLAAGPLLIAPASAAEEERAPPGLLAAVEGRPVAPALSLGVLDGAPATLAADAPPTIVHFFATWCAPCRTELPALADFGRRSGVRVLLVDVAEPADRIRRFFAEGTAGAASGPVLLDQNRAAARGWGVSLLPASFVVISGRLVLAYEGEVDWADSRTHAAIAAAAAPPQKNQPKEAQGEQTR